MPVCQKCHKPMKKKETLSFSYALQIVIDNAIRSAACMPAKPTEWACVGKKPNEDYKKWQEKKKVYDKQMKEYMDAKAENDKRLIFKKKLPPMPAPLPPPPPKEKPCVSHWKEEYVNKSIKIKKKKEFYYVDEITGMAKKVP